MGRVSKAGVAVLQADIKMFATLCDIGLVSNGIAALTATIYGLVGVISDGVSLERDERRGLRLYLSKDWGRAPHDCDLQGIFG
jgi:hypothetical protein